MDASKLMANVSLVPVVTIEKIEQAEPLAEALLSAGLTVVEVTLRTPVALKALKRIAGKSDLLVGAGSVRTAEQMQQVKEAGAEFAVSPGHSVDLIDAAKAADMPFIPGGATPSEMIFLLDHGYELQKFFPAEQLGGLNMLKALSAPLPDIRFCPTGGIHAGLARDYLAFDKVACIGGSWFLDATMMQSGDWYGFEEKARLAVERLSG